VISVVEAGYVRRSEFRRVRGEIAKLAADTLSQISRSADEVSPRLGRLFDQAIATSSEEIKHAMDRKERGNPPGKFTDPLGDQLIWEPSAKNIKSNGFGSLRNTKTTS
jgi:hypothetical protein